MGFNAGKVFLILICAAVAAILYIFTQKDMVDAIGLWVNEKLSPQEKIKVSDVVIEEKPLAPKVIVLERPDPKFGAHFVYRFELYGKSDLVTNAETRAWTIAAKDKVQVTWEGEGDLIEVFSRNPFLPAQVATTTLYQPVGRLDYLTPTDVFPLSSSAPRMVKIQNRTHADSKPYEWSCLVTGQENLKVMAGEFPVDIVTCVASGGWNGTETFKYSRKHGHWISRERRGFDQPKLTVELVSYEEP